MKIDLGYCAHILTISVLVAACSSDGGGQVLPDSGTATGGGDAGVDAPVGTGVVECAGKPDGTDCSGTGSTGQICLLQLCFTSTCGDGFVDSRIGESCEDKSDVPGDGCAFCKFDCSKKEDCDDGLPCNGTETCDVTHACTAGAAAAPNTACTLAAGGAGVCSQGACVRAGCGNKMMDAGEDCDDVNTDDSDGCTRDCKFTCTTPADCDDMNACTGTETCNVVTHTCVAGTAVSCADPGCATPGACNPADGTCAYPDVDKDGSGCNRDCNDADPANLPGGFECKDTQDNDCNPATADATAPACECYVDIDKDGFAATTVGAVVSPGASCPVGYTRVRPVNAANTDCAPGFASVFPGQSMYFATGYCAIRCATGNLGAFDYNCDKAETRSRPILSLLPCTGRNNILACAASSGWVGKVPMCGVSGTYRACSWNKLSGTCVGKDTPNETQACR